MPHDNIWTIVGLACLLPKRAFTVICHTVIAADISHNRLAVIGTLAGGYPVTIHTALFHWSALDLVTRVVGCNTTTRKVTELSHGLHLSKQ